MDIARKRRKEESLGWTRWLALPRSSLCAPSCAALHSFITHQHVHSRSELHSTDTCRRRAEKQPKKRMRRDPYMNSGGRAPADMGGEPPNGRAKGQRASSQNRMFRGPLKRRRLRPSSRMSTTQHEAGFEAGTHSRSPLQGAITRGAPHVPHSKTPT